MIDYLPSDWRQALLVGRLQTREGPTPVVVVEGRVRDVSRHAPTVSQLLNGWNGTVPEGQDLGPLESFNFTRAVRPQGAAGTRACCRRSTCNASRRAA